MAEEGSDGVTLKGGVRDAGAVDEAGEGRGAVRGGGHGDAVAGDGGSCGVWTGENGGLVFVAFFVS